MDQGSLVREQIDAAARFLVEFHKAYPVDTAFWLRDCDDGEWKLYVVSTQITDDNFDVAYGEVARIAIQLKEPWFDAFRVKLIGSDDPLAKAALEIQRRNAGRSSAWLGGNGFGLGVQQAYVYASPLPAPVQP